MEWKQIIDHHFVTDQLPSAKEIPLLYSTVSLGHLLAQPIQVGIDLHHLPEIDVWGHPGNV